MWRIGTKCIIIGNLHVKGTTIFMFLVKTKLVWNSVKVSGFSSQYSWRKSKKSIIWAIWEGEYVEFRLFQEEFSFTPLKLIKDFQRHFTEFLLHAEYLKLDHYDKNNLRINYLKIKILSETSIQGVSENMQQLITST